LLLWCWTCAQQQQQGKQPMLAEQQAASKRQPHSRRNGSGSGSSSSAHASQQRLREEGKMWRRLPLLLLSPAVSARLLARHPARQCKRVNQQPMLLLLLLRLISCWCCLHAW
jgi:hypothetical protein